MSILSAETLPASVVDIFNFEGVGGCSTVVEYLNGLIGLSAEFRFKRSRASNSASENCLMCFGRNGTGVDTREVKNCDQSASSHGVIKGLHTELAALNIAIKDA